MKTFFQNVASMQINQPSYFIQFESDELDDNLYGSQAQVDTDLENETDTHSESESEQ